MFPEEYLAKQWDQTQLADGTPILAVIDRLKTNENVSPNTASPYRVVLPSGASFTATMNGYECLYNGRRLKPIEPSPAPATRPMTREEWPDGPVMVRRESLGSQIVKEVFYEGIGVWFSGYRSWQQLHDEVWEYHTGQGEWKPCKVVV